MNGYDLTRIWYNFKFENKDKVKHVHSDLYFYIVDLWNRLGQKKEFGLPTSVTMESVNINSYNTYKKTLEDLIQWGFIKECKKSINQYNSRVIALSKIDKALYKALDKAIVNANDNPLDKSLVIIEEQQTINNKQQTIITFEEFWSLYPKKVAKELCKSKFERLSNKDLEKIKSTIDTFLITKPFESYTHPNPSTYLNQKRWNDVVSEKPESVNSVIPVGMVNGIDGYVNAQGKWIESIYYDNDGNRIDKHGNKLDNNGNRI